MDQTDTICIIERERIAKMLNQIKTFLRPCVITLPPYVAPIALPNYDEKLIHVL